MAAIAHFLLTKRPRRWRPAASQGPPGWAAANPAHKSECHPQSTSGAPEKRLDAPLALALPKLLAWRATLNQSGIKPLERLAQIGLAPAPVGVPKALGFPACAWYIAAHLWSLREIQTEQCVEPLQDHNDCRRRQGAGELCPSCLPIQALHLIR
jgi:hypothetical protein